MNEGESYLLALEQTTGNVAWKVDRNYNCNKETAQSYTTPIIVTENNITSIIVWGANHLTSQNATTGEWLWKKSGMGTDVATPVLVQDKMLLRGTKNLYCIGALTR